MVPLCLWPMSGDVNLVDRATRLLVEQTSDVIGALAKDNEPYALRGHSMATDISVRVAASRKDVGPVVLISAL
jgi:pimeloyl-ACP methyl ester carboxylesterase